MPEGYAAAFDSLGSPRPLAIIRVPLYMCRYVRNIGCLRELGCSREYTWVGVVLAVLIGVRQADNSVPADDKLGG